jgi:hypothetical protein
MGPMFYDLWSQFSSIFSNFRRKNWRFSCKPMLWSIFCKTISSLSQKRQFFRPDIWAKRLKRSWRCKFLLRWRCKSRSWSQSYDFLICSYNANVVVGLRGFTSEKKTILKERCMYVNRDRRIGSRKRPKIGENSANLEPILPSLVTTPAV